MPYVAAYIVATGSGLVVVVQGTLRIGKNNSVAYLMESSVRVQEQGKIGREQFTISIRLSPERCICKQVRSPERLTSTSRDLVRVACVCLSCHTGT